MPQKRVINHQYLDMNDDEYKLYQRLVEEFSDATKTGAWYFREMFIVGEDGVISSLNIPTNKQIPWSIVLFLQNLMINQRLRKMESTIEEKINE